MSTGGQIHASVHVFEPHVVVPGPVVPLAHHQPHIPGVAPATLAERRDLLLTGQGGGEVVRVQIAMGGHVFQPHLLTTLDGLAPDAVVLVPRALDGPVAVDILLDDCPRHRLLPGSRPVLDIVAMEPHFVLVVHKLH